MQRKKRILITGGAGFIGSHCVDLFLGNDFEVGVFDIKTPQEAENLAHCLDAVVYIEGDIRDVVQLNAVMGEFTHVLHLAAEVSVQRSIEYPLQTHETNVTGTLNVLQSASMHDVERVIYASSAAVYGDTQIVPTPEDAPLQPLSPYGVHKKMNEEYAELYAKQYGLLSTGLRFFNVYGSRQDPSSPYSGVISIFDKCMKEGVCPTIYGDGFATRDFIHVHDVARVCLAVIESEKELAPVYNIGTGIVVSIEELVQTLHKVHNVSHQPEYKSARIGDIVHSCALVERMNKDFGAQAELPIEKGLEELQKHEGSMENKSPMP